MHYTECENIPAILIAIDFEKAFDCLDWSFLHLCLSKFGFPNTILKWVQTLYSNISSCVTNNGFASSHFPVERGVRQGCPLSPYLFIIAVETLAIAMRENEKIKGIKIGSKEPKKSQYADDTSLTMLFCNESINATFDIFDDFGRSSGLKINYNKTEILRIGSMKSSNRRLYTIKEVSWSNDSIRILGIEITVNDDIEKLKILPVISKMENIIKMWSWRQLTLY